MLRTLGLTRVHESITVNDTQGCIASEFHTSFEEGDTVESVLKERCMHSFVEFGNLTVFFFFCDTRKCGSPLDIKKMLEKRNFASWRRPLIFTICLCARWVCAFNPVKPNYRFVSPQHLGVGGCQERHSLPALWYSTV